MFPPSRNARIEPTGRRIRREMEIKQIEVDCPCCATRLTIDVLTRTVLRSAEAREVDETGKVKLDEGRWERAAQRVEERPAAAKDRLEEALDHERTKEDRLDDLFEKARRKVEERRPADEA